MQTSRERAELMEQPEQIAAYFAGRFDGDGSVNKDGKTFCRIAYSTEAEAKMDQMLLVKIGVTATSVYHYRQAREYCLYISKNVAQSFIDLIRRYATTTPEMHTSIPVETSSRAEARWDGVRTG